MHLNNLNAPSSMG